MRYFIESVHTLNTTGKSAKGALLQAIAKKYEHIILQDDRTLAELVATLRRLVEAVNACYRGKQVVLEHDPGIGYITAGANLSGEGAYIFNIIYAHIAGLMSGNS